MSRQCTRSANTLGCLLAASVTLALTACSAGSQTVHDAATDRVARDTVVMDVPEDREAADTAVRCNTASDCDDGIACTVDECNAEGLCTHRPEDSRCDDGRFCNGAERCDPAARGCVASTPPNCDDGDSCTIDRCDEGDNRCRHDLRDSDGDGDVDRACGGGDCNDTDRTVNSLDPEVCNGRDDNCNGMVDEGVLNSCGNCDPTCRSSSTGGTSGRPFSDAGRQGVDYDPMLGGLVVRAETRMADYLWVPNTAESTVSKWDAVTGRELARYRVGLPSGECRGACCWNYGCNMPSRTAVDGNGDAYVANRGFGMQGTVTKIAADRRDCIDRNRNGMIDTSTGSTPLPWGEDECVLWTVNVGPSDAVLRAIAIDRGDAMFPQGYPWVGGFNNRVFYKLNPRTGAVMASVTVPVRPYGAVVAADGRLWVGTIDEGATAWIDTTTNAVSPRIGYPTGMRAPCYYGNQGYSYGITTDTRGRIWFSGGWCRDALGYDPRSGQWTRVDLTGIIPWGAFAGRGITADAMGRVWMAFSTSELNRSNLAWWNSDAFVPGGTIPGGSVRVININDGYQNPMGVGLDRNGNVWLPHLYGSSELVRYNPMTGARDVFLGANRPYVYSDFTGSVRRTVIGTGTYTEDYDAGCSMPVFSQLEWDATTPPGTSLTFSLRTADTVAALDAAMAVTVAVAPRDASPVDVAAALRAAGVTPRRYARVTVTFNPSTMPIASPVLRSLRLVWHCPYPFPS